MKSRYIDADAHFIEPPQMWAEFLEDGFKEMAPKAVTNSVGRPCVLIGDQLTPGSFASYVDTPETRLKAMDGEGIEAMVLYPTVGLFFGGLRRIDLYAALCRAYNNWASQYCKVNPKRLIAPAMVPQADIFSSMKEARRGIEKLGLNGVFLRPNPIEGRTFDHPAWEPFWSLLEELDAPLVLHEGTAGGGAMAQVGQDRFESHLFKHAISHPSEHMMAMMCLICGGVMDRHPKLRVMHVEAGCGWVPYWLERMDHHATTKGVSIAAGGRTKLSMLPSEFFKRQFVVSADPEENILTHVIGAIGGDDNIAFSTDFPHTDHEFHGMFAKCAARPELSESSKAKILGENVARFMKI